MLTSDLRPWPTKVSNFAEIRKALRIKAWKLQNSYTFSLEPQSKILTVIQY
jgi:hypothetical protein